MTRHYGDRMIAVALAVVGLGLVAASFAVWVQAGQIKQQRAAMNQLLSERAEDRQDAARLRSLVLRLQQQVRDLGGTPAELPPPAGTTPAPSASAPVERSPRATAAATRSPRPTAPSPRPSRSPSSPSPTPSPSPTRLCIGPVCLPPQEVPR